MISSSENRVSYNGNGTATEFAYQFKILEKSDIKVMRVDADGNTEILTKDYYVDTEKNVVIYPGYAPGAEIPESERPPVLPSGWRLVLYREVPITQLSRLPEIWPFNVIEAMADKLTIICQQLKDAISRCLKINESSDKNIDTTIPWEAGKTFRVSDDGTHLESTEDPGKVYEASKGFAEAAATSATNAIAANKEAQQANEEVKQIYNNGSLTPISDLAGSIGTELKRWGTIFANKVFASNLPLMYNSVSDMKSDKKLKAGMTACTLGYYSPNDGGAGTYIIRAKQDGDVDDGTYYVLDNKLLAKKVAIKPNQYLANTLEEAQLLLDNGHSIIINRNFNVKKSLNVTKNNITITFTANGKFICNDLAIPCLIIGSDTQKVVYFLLENFSAIGNATPNSIGILIKNMGYCCEIFRPHIFNFDKGIVTSSFDCAQISTFYEPYLGQCNIGFDDTQGGIQACRIYGGRIEQNKQYGIVSASPNVHYIGCVIEGNTIANVKFYNVYSDLYKQTMPCGGTFTNCYFETLNESEANIIFGDAEKNIFGIFNFIGCQCFLKGTTMPYIKQEKSDEGEASTEKSITIIGGNCLYGTVFDLQNVETDTFITCCNLYYKGVHDITENIGNKAKIIVNNKKGVQYTNINKANIYAGVDNTTTNITKSANIVITKRLQIEASSSVNVGKFIEITQSELLPWEDTTTGILKGSVHIYNVDGTWYIRKNTLNGTDTQSNWKEIALK